MCCLKDEEQILVKSKSEYCLDIFKNNKSSRFVIYSSFDNIYYQLFEEIDRLGLKAERVESNLFSLLKTVKNFQEGRTNILFVSNVYMGDAKVFDFTAKYSGDYTIEYIFDKKDIKNPNNKCVAFGLGYK
jgi:hypothetical protein